MRFTDCYTGEVGSVHDAVAFKRSDLYECMMTDGSMFTSDRHIVGHAAYPLLKHLMVPFKDTGCLSARQKKYNTELASVRCVVERAFALLKGRFRRLKFLDMNRTDLVPKVIMACCIMHNLCIDNTDIVDDDIDAADEDNASDDRDESDHPSRSNVAQRQVAVAKRNAIAAQL